MNQLTGLLRLVIVTMTFAPLLAQAAHLSGQIVDLNGAAVADAMIIISPTYPGPTAITVFSDSAGKFQFPEQQHYRNSSDININIRALGYELQNTQIKETQDGASLTVIARYTANQVNSAPPSAWLHRVDHETASTFVMDCIGCHQVPSPEFRHYAAAMNDIKGDDRAHIASEGWWALIRYMNYLSAEEFGRGPDVPAPNAHNAYSVGDGDRVVNFLTEHYADRMESISGYAWGAPLAVTADTSIMEYEIPRPNAVREAILMGTPKQLYVADVASNRIFKVDPDSGYTSVLDIPSDTPMGPHSLHRGGDNTLWIAPFVSSVVARLDVAAETWQTWNMKSLTGQSTGIHDLSTGADHTLLTDKQGNVWFSDISNSAVGYLDPRTGDIEIYKAPTAPGRTGAVSLYGLVMTADQEHLWFSELGMGALGSFNIATRQFEDFITLEANAGPRRLSIDEKGLMYVPLYGRGQLLVYDTKNTQQVGLYDLPDTASAPYATTWDPVRKVGWIPTSNADAMYKFDPANNSFSVLPMPRTGALLRMVDIDPDTGKLILSYGNIVEQVHGPRMALIIEPGDGLYR